MQVERIDAERGLALCAADDGSKSTVEIALVEPVEPGDRLLVHAGRRARGAPGMKYVDEFRDPELGRVLANEILAAVEPGRHYKFMEVCGGHTHSIYKYGVDDLLPGERRARPRARAARSA